MNAIGGYFELELTRGEEYHKEAIRLNTGRNAFEYILKAKGYKKVYLPYYTCDVMLEPIHKMKLDYAFYHIDQSFRPVFDFSNLKQDEVFVYNNYFGICDKQIFEVSQKCKSLIIDNSQAFYAKPIPGVDTFYSPRKFFGIPDGAYLYINQELEIHFENDISYNRFNHLLGRIDTTPEEFYPVFKQNDEALNNQPIKKMSKLTHRLLTSINYEEVATRRKANFNFLHQHLQKINQLNFNFAESVVPMIYPFFIENGAEIKKQLIANKIFVATYWPNVLEWTKKEDIEFNFVKNLIAIPIDQRYSEKEMFKIVSVIQEYV